MTNELQEYLKQKNEDVISERWNNVKGWVIAGIAIASSLSIFWVLFWTI